MFKCDICRVLGIPLSNKSYIHNENRRILDCEVCAVIQFRPVYRPQSKLTEITHVKCTCCLGVEPWLPLCFVCQYEGKS
jgi:hypothetical protein